MTTHVFVGPDFLLEIPKDLEKTVLMYLTDEFISPSPEFVENFLQELSLLCPSRDIIQYSIPGCPFVPIIFNPEIFSLHIAEASQIPFKKNNAFLYYIVRLDDTRVASGLFCLLARHSFLSLRYGRLLLCSNNSGIPPEKVLDSALQRMNLDTELFDEMQKDLPLAISHLDAKIKETTYYRKIAASANSSHSIDMYSSTSACVPKDVLCTVLVDFLATTIQYVAVLDLNGSASPFLVGLGLLFHFKLSPAEVVEYFSRHDSRCLRALALYFARYTIPIEHLQPFFLPSIDDSVVVQCSSRPGEKLWDLSVLCQMLLYNDEVCEAWLPTYHIHWLEIQVPSLVNKMKSSLHFNQDLLDTTHEGSNSLLKMNESTEKEVMMPRATGMGIGINKMRLVDLEWMLREASRMTSHKRFITSLQEVSSLDDRDCVNLLKTEDDSSEQNEDSRYVSGEGEEVNNSNTSNKKNSSKETIEGNSKRNRNDEFFLIDPRKLATTSAQKTILHLLGATPRHVPSHESLEHFLRF